MKITILQTNIIWASPEANAIEAEKLIASAPQSDLYVLPEMWSTGFATEPTDIAEKDSTSLNWMTQIAQRQNAAVSGSVAIEHEGLFYNRHYFCLPDGTLYTYDKHHLFSYGGENRFYTPGNKRTIASYKGIRFLLQTCYDLRFPEWNRYRGDFDAIICVANWPQKRMLAWETLIRARAIDNECLVIAANRVGNDKQYCYEGRSAIINAYGEPLALATDDMQMTISADFDINQQNDYRKKFPVLEEIDK
ncbi:MAG: nitrilase family protein [Prevotella sp.]|nr:nitrilase family protein [Prevotella sp.]